MVSKKSANIFIQKPPSIHDLVYLGEDEGEDPADDAEGEGVEDSTNEGQAVHSQTKLQGRVHILAQQYTSQSTKQTRRYTTKQKHSSSETCLFKGTVSKLKMLIPIMQMFCCL